MMKTSRKVRFTLPESGIQKKESEQKVAVHGTQKYVNGTLVSNNSKQIKNTSNVIVNRNASSAPSNRRFSTESISQKPVLPKIESPEDSRYIIQEKPMKRSTYTAVTAAVKLQRPKTSNLTRSQSFSVKKALKQQETSIRNKRFSDSFLYKQGLPLNDTPNVMIKIDDTDRHIIEMPQFQHAINPNLLKIPLAEDDNANYLPHISVLDDDDENSCLKGLYDRVVQIFSIFMYCISLVIYFYERVYRARSFTFVSREKFSSVLGLC